MVVLAVALDGGVMSCVYDHAENRLSKQRSISLNLNELWIKRGNQLNHSDYVLVHSSASRIPQTPEVVQWNQEESVNCSLSHTHAALWVNAWMCSIVAPHRLGCKTRGQPLLSSTADDNALQSPTGVAHLWVSNACWPVRCGSSEKKNAFTNKTQAIFTSLS